MTTGAYCSVSHRRAAGIEQDPGDESSGQDVQICALVFPHDDVAQHGTGHAIAHTAPDSEVVIPCPLTPSRLVEIFDGGDADLRTAIEKKRGHLLGVWEGGGEGGGGVITSYHAHFDRPQRIRSRASRQ